MAPAPSAATQRMACQTRMVTARKATSFASSTTFVLYVTTRPRPHRRQRLRPRPRLRLRLHPHPYLLAASLTSRTWTIRRPTPLTHPVAHRSPTPPWLAV